MDTWRSVTSLPTDVKELIPEFYSTDSSFLVNMEGIDFGERSSGPLIAVHARTLRTYFMCSSAGICNF